MLLDFPEYLQWLIKNRMKEKQHYFFLDHPEYPINICTYFFYLFRMLGLGLGAWEMIQSQDFREPKLELPLILQFLPAMMSLIVDDQV